MTCLIYTIINAIIMTEDRNQIDIYVDKIKEERKPNENVSRHNISNNAEESSNNFLDLNLNADYYAEDEPRSAPVEILSEFLSTFMSHDYKSALHYCKLILQYEPDNEIVQDFYPLILEKIDLNDLMRLIINKMEAKTGAKLKYNKLNCQNYIIKLRKLNAFRWINQKGPSSSEEPETACLQSDNSESDEFADNEASSFSTKSESSTEYFSNASAGSENTSACSSLSSDEDARFARSKE